MNWWLFSFGLVAALCIGIFTLFYALMRMVCGRNDRFIKDFDKAIDEVDIYSECKNLILQGKRWLDERKPQEVSTHSFDGLKLVGEYIPCENARGTVIMFHGWNGSPVTDFGAGLPHYHALGLNLLLVHQRAQGKSEGKYMTFGIRERKDVRTWVKWHRERFGDLPVLLAGLSMGASTVLMSCSDAHESCVKGVIADCGFTSPYEIICSVIDSMHLPARPLAFMLGIHTKLFAGFGLKEYSTEDAMKNAKLPILFVHGEDDKFVPCYMSQTAYDACMSMDKTFLRVPKATHGKSFVVDPEKYKSTLKEFFDRCLGESV